MDQKDINGISRSIKKVLMKRGIYLVANRKSQEMCANLIYSIRAGGCDLPIRLIHFGGEEVCSSYVLAQAELIRFETFPDEAKQFILNLRTVLTDCPLGFLYRYLAWFSDWDEFIYSDNDIVALCDWTELFSYIDGFDLVHADEEYTTKGIYNYVKPELIEDFFGSSALETAITAGHIVVRKNNKMVEDINQAVEWFKQYPHIPHKHDQALLHIATLIGNWRVLNLCRAENAWLSSWAGDYKNTLHLIQSIQTNNSKISHLHYSGGTPKGNLAIQELLFSSDSDDRRLSRLFTVGVKFKSKYESLNYQLFRIRRFLESKTK